MLKTMFLIEFGYLFEPFAKLIISKKFYLKKLFISTRFKLNSNDLHGLNLVLN